MSDYSLEDAINAAKNNDVLDFKNAIHSAIEDKVSSELELKKMEFAGTIFGDAEETIETEIDLEPEEISYEEEQELEVQEE